MDGLQDAYDDYIENLFHVFVNEIISGQDIEEAATRFKAGVEITNKAFVKAKEIMASM